MKQIWISIGICIFLITSAFVYCVVIKDPDGAKLIMEFIDKIKEPIMGLLTEV